MNLRQVRPQVDALARALDQVRQRRPVVHAITNWVTAGDVANVLHVVGARPVLAFALEEVTDIVAGADALVLNLGTPTPPRVTAMLLAGHRANTLGRPVIFDPVGAGASGFRTGAAQRILSELHIAVVKGNRAEIGTLASMGGQLRGVDAAAGPLDVRAAAEALARRTGAVVAVSGPSDLVVDGGQAVGVHNGHPLMGRVTGTGCMLTAVVAAFAAVEMDPVVATVAAVACFGLAGEHAAGRASGPGTFKVALLDALFALTPDDLRAGVRLEG
jgi:hydroxyethylthiazole kinase